MTEMNFLTVLEAESTRSELVSPAASLHGWWGLPLAVSYLLEPSNRCLHLQDSCSTQQPSDLSRMEAHLPALLFSQLWELWMAVICAAARICWADSPTSPSPKKTAHQNVGENKYYHKRDPLKCTLIY